MQLPTTPANLRDLHPQQIYSSVALSKQARFFVQEDNSLLDFFDACCAQRLWFDATTLLAHALHKRAAIWWARLVCGDIAASQSPQCGEVLALIENWIREPAQEKTHAIIAATAMREKDDALYWMGMAVRWSVATLESQPGHHVRATPNLYACAVSAAIDICASQNAQKNTRDYFYRQALARGRDIAQGGNGRLQNENIYLQDDKNQKYFVAPEEKSR